MPRLKNISLPFEYISNGDKPSFPLDIFPENIRYVISRLSETSNFEIQIVSCAMLFTVSTIIGNSKQVKVKSTWIDTPNLWIAIVGRRGTMKTPTVNYCIKPLTIDEKQYQFEFSNALSSYLAIPKKDRNENDRPARQQRYSNDPTVEGLIKAMNDNINGMGIYKDELNGFFEEMNRYSSGGNLEFYLSAFSGGQYIKNRASYDAITVDDIFLSMLGSIQPEKLKLLSGTNTDNGMLDRWLFVESDNRIPHTTLDDIPQPMTDEYTDFINGIANKSTGRTLLSWDEGALDRFVLYINHLEKRMAADNCEDSLFTYLSKVKTYTARFLVIVAVMNNTNIITIDIVNRAAKLSNYFIQTAIRTFISFENQNSISIIFENEEAKSKAEKVMALIKNMPEMNNSEISRQVPCSRQYVVDTRKKFGV